MVEEKSRDIKKEILIEITDCKEEEKSIRNKLLFMGRKTRLQLLNFKCQFHKYIGGLVRI